MDFSADELKQLMQKGISKEKLLDQLNNYQRGFPYTKLIKPAIKEEGIVVLSEKDTKRLLAKYAKVEKDLDLLKFTPASGAASRMLKFLHEALNGKNFSDNIEIIKFFKEISKFPFYDTLLSKNTKPGVDKSKTLDLLLNKKPFEFSNKPKGLIPFHLLNGDLRLSFEEHFAEGALYSNGKNGIRLHFTISFEHEKMFKAESKTLIQKYETKYGNAIDLTFSFQHENTDVVAVDMDNKPIGVEKKILFRPGGHGALIENLQSLDADIIFIKNIDNVLPPNFHHDITRNKKLLAAILLSVSETLFKLQHRFDKQGYSEELATDVTKYAKNIFGLKIQLKNGLELKEFLFKPIRVCGMVKNEGEPGGGPFWVENNGEISLQIVESSQIDLTNQEQFKIYKESTHFNPVDLVCNINNYQGQKYKLQDFIDFESGFISEKSYQGSKIKVQELPGLWNGAMAKWHTLFVEVPLITFNPVKTINDLLKENHLV